MKKSSTLNSPEGMKSYLPETAVEFEDIKSSINKVFTSWGYRTVMTPVLEYYSSLLTGMGQNTKKEFYKLIDYEGNILALRPEMTAPIARTVVNRSEELSLPLRLSYCAPVYRYESPQMGKNREILQIGMEFIGENSFADVEAIIIAIEAIKSTGIKNFKLDLGHTGYLEGMINQFDLTKKEEKKLKSYLNKKDFVGLKDYINSLQIEEQNLLMELPLLRGNQDILIKARNLVDNQTSLAAINKLEDVYECLSSYGVAEYVNFDLGLIRGLDYYTGLVFEGFTEGLGYTVCGGGRYDNLIKQFGGKKVPAVGFAIGLERIRLSLQKQGFNFSRREIDGLIIFPPVAREIALNTARDLHQKGLSIIMKEAENINEDIIQMGRDKGVRKILSFSSLESRDVLKIIDLHSSNQQKKEIKMKKGWENRIWNN